MSKFKSGDKVKVKENWRYYHSKYGQHHVNTLLMSHDMEYDKKLTIQGQHETFNELYMIVENLHWYHENWLEFAEPEFELGEELFLV